MFFDIEIWGFVREKSQAIFEKQLLTISKFNQLDFNFVGRN